MSYARKALVAAAAAALSFLAPVFDDGMTGGELLGAVAAALLAGSAVYATRNAEPVEPS